MKKTLIIAAISLFAAYHLPTAAVAQDDIVDGVAAVVGRNIIKYSDVERSYAQIRLKQGAADAFNNRCAVLENLILSQLLVHKGEVDSVEVTDDEINQYVEYYLKNDMRNYGTREALHEATGFTYEELKEQYQRMIHNNLLARRVEYQLTEDVTVTPRQVADFFSTLPADSLPMMPERYELSEIVIEPKISEAERDRVRTQLAELRERIIKGEKFSMLATLYSQDPGSAKKGGELGFFSRGDMVSDFESAAFALKPGEVSPVVETQYGYHIIQLIERRGNNINVRHILLQPKISSTDLLQARVTLDSLAQEIRQGNISFEDAARKYSDGASKNQGGVVSNPVQGSPRFDKESFNQLYPGIGIVAMEEGEISNAASITTEDNKSAYCLIKLNKKIPAHKINLTDDYDRIYNAALQNAQSKKIYEWCSRMVRTTYVRIDDEYKDCDCFKVKWLL